MHHHVKLSLVRTWAPHKTLEPPPQLNPMKLQSIAQRKFLTSFCFCFSGTKQISKENHQVGNYLLPLTWTESALMISPLRRLASSSASLLFPTPVGPDITITFSLFFVAEAEHFVVDSRRRTPKANGVVRRRGLSGDEGRRRQHVRTLP